MRRLIEETTGLMHGKRLNVAIGQLMELTSALRKAIDTGPGAGDPAVREGAEALMRMLSCFAPYTAEQGWQRLGRDASVIEYGWPLADPELVAQQTVTCVVQVAGKVRDRLDVSPTIGADQLRELALDSEKIRHVLGNATVAKVIIRPPKRRYIVIAPQQADLVSSRMDDIAYWIHDSPGE